MTEYEYVTLAGFMVIEVGPPSRRRNVLAISELVFTTERDARLAAKESGGTWIRRRKHKTRKVEMRRAKKELRDG